MTCTFFGHRECPDNIKQLLRRTIIDLIENKDIDNFYVGNNGNFDSMVYTMLDELSKKYNIKYAIVLAYLPNKEEHPKNTIFPEGFESIFPKFAINHRNNWMIDHSDYVVTYVRYSFGGAAKFKDLAIKRNKIIINL